MEHFGQEDEKVENPNEVTIVPFPVHEKLNERMARKKSQKSGKEKIVENYLENERKNEKKKSTLLFRLKNDILSGVEEWNEKEKEKQLNKRIDEIEEEKLILIDEKDVRKWERTFQMRAELLPTHLKSECPNRLVVCGECTVPFISKNKKVHFKKIDVSEVDSDEIINFLFI